MSCSKIIVNATVMFLWQKYFMNIYKCTMWFVWKRWKRKSHLFFMSASFSVWKWSKVWFLQTRSHFTKRHLVLSFFSFNVEYKSVFFLSKKKNISIGFHVKLFQCLSSHLNWSKKWCKNNWICFTRVPLDIQVSF
jgi:hypothetical protein